MSRTASLLIVTTAVVLVATPASSATSASFKNCTAMHSVYRHGVGRVGARDHTSGKPVTTFQRSNSLYRSNQGLDRDKDGIACEKK